MRKTSGSKLSKKTKRPSKMMAASPTTPAKRKGRSTRGASKISLGSAVGATASKVARSVATVAKAIKKGGLKSLTARGTAAKKSGTRRPATQAH